MLEVQNLRKTFGKNVAVNDISFKVEKGSILGIIGQNGSGKTTLFRLILDFLTPEGNGKVLWDNQKIGKELENSIGYLPEERGLYEDMTVENQILLFSELRGLDPKVTAGKIDEWMDRFSVKGSRKDKVNTLSKGNQQKVQVIATLIHEPQLIILDEPFSGLDPVNADLLKQAILQLKQNGSCIIFSSHNMANVEEICDTMLMIHNGEPVLAGQVQEVRNTFGRIHLYIKTDKWTKESLSELEGIQQVDELDRNEFKLVLEDESYGSPLFDTITQGQYISNFNQTPPTLEEIFKLKAGESLE
ncbi:ATP-binding cassette domain-containing protein [Aerococcaceae bacterium DSM 111176]|nr:ATP-binding cassette domain-containing protein [Aerococcaceae bacterium DSM 111176]